ncbi:hypothetical protein [Nocardioides sp.]|uniref:hypothetical protein n=1 Tax=Nocardioides sp. TaxID=35761 RepID=UPI0026030D46|nr:hypothetical protein [Nocardioides sp.]
MSDAVVLEYDSRVAESKVRKTLTLDPEVVEAFGGDARALSAAVNDVLRAEVERRNRRRALREWLDELEEKFGPPDPAEVERAKEVFRGLARP